MNGYITQHKMDSETTKFNTPRELQKSRESRMERHIGIQEMR